MAPSTLLAIIITIIAACVAPHQAEEERAAGEGPVQENPGAAQSGGQCGSVPRD